MSDENRIRLIASQPIRGRILDKNGYVLADSRVKYSLIIKPQSVKKNNWEKHKSSISNLLNIDSNEIQKKYSDGLKNQKLSVIILDDLNVDQLIRFKENEGNLISFEIDFVINPIETPTLKVPVRILLKIRWLSSGNVSQIFLILKFFSSSLSFDKSGIVLLSNSLRLIFDNLFSL